METERLIESIDMYQAHLALDCVVFCLVCDERRSTLWIVSNRCRLILHVIHTPKAVPKDPA